MSEPKSVLRPVDSFSRSAKRHRLREGFTTGSAAAAAAKAAVTALLSGREAKSALVALPPFSSVQDGLKPLTPARLDIKLDFCRVQALNGAAKVAQSGVIKDGGDDPDATHGMLLAVSAALSDEAFFSMPGTWLRLTDKIRVKAGTGIGLATLPGLPVNPGEPAINPEPRKQIAFAVQEAVAESSHAGPVYLYLEAPEGEKRAKRTLNGRMGIVGGISILGTRGTVRPFSHDAWRAAIGQGLDIAFALGLDSVAFSTGRRSEAALQRTFPALPPQSYIQAADYARFSLDEAARRGFRHVIWGCYIGKLLKLAQGLEQTHAKNGQADLGLLAELAQARGASPVICAALRALPTAQGAFDLLSEGARPGGPNDPASGAAAPPARQVADLLAGELAEAALGFFTGWAADKAAKPERITLCLYRKDNSLWVQTSAPVR